jgi:hypothetical protein
MVCDPVHTGINLPTFRKNLLLSSSSNKNEEIDSVLVNVRSVFGRKQTVITAEILRPMETRLQTSPKKLVSRTEVIMQQSFLKMRQDCFFAIA